MPFAWAAVPADNPATMTPMRQATVFLEAFIGLDPHSPKTWSGSLPFLLDAMRDAGRLERTLSLPLPPIERALLLARSFSSDRAAWRRRYYFSPAYRKAVTRQARRTRYPGPVALQVGALYSLPEALPNVHCLSLHDGNLAERVDSGVGLHGFSRQRLDETLRYEEQVANQMTTVLTLSEYLRQSFIRNYHVPPERVVSVGGAVNLRELPPEQPGKDYANQQVLFIGAEFARKGGPQLLQAFAIVRQTLPAATLHIVGPTGIGEVPPGVTFHGHLSKGNPEQKLQLEALLQHCSLFVLPSLYEPYGIAPLEAMLYQMPAIVTNAWALGEIVTPGVNGTLVEKGSVEDLAATMLDLLADPHRLMTLGRQARALVVPRYTWPAVAGRIAAVIDSL